MNAPTNRCPDCGVAPGELHEAGCDVEQCADCGQQCNTCACAVPSASRLPWTGEWPGNLECREFGWHVKWSGSRWRRCGANYPGSQADLSRLRTDAIWDKQRGRYVLPATPPEAP